MPSTLSVRNLIDDEAGVTMARRKMRMRRRDLFINNEEDIAGTSEPEPSSPPLVPQNLALFLRVRGCCGEHPGKTCMPEDAYPNLHDVPGSFYTPRWTILGSGACAGEEQHALDVILDQFGNSQLFSAVVIRPSIPGYVFVEVKTPIDIQHCVEGISSVLKLINPLLIPIASRTEYL
ncbi:hypothetical protein BC834DRAFT_975053 [Gloeopeniophorella convolvens]|nr:hypothetical protein BC834DRAFT_975053 [Gloeopeniophorella convolvens]